MAEEYGLFWNSRGGDRKYHADSFSDWLKKFFTTGVFNGDLFVEAAGGMDITVSPGYVNIDGKVMMWDIVQNFTLDVAYASYDRVDAVVVERNDADRIFTTKIVKGGTDGEPPAPVRSNGVYQLVLAHIAVAHGATAVTQANITDERSDSDLCGWVTGTVEEIDFSQITAQWETYYTEFKNFQMADWEEWVRVRKAGWLEWVAYHEQEWAEWSAAQRAAWALWVSEQEDDIEAFKNSIETDLSQYSAEIQAEYNALANQLHNLIDGEAAAILQEQIDELKIAVADKDTIVQLPSIVGGTYTYNGQNQGPTITGYDNTHCTTTGTTTAKNVGSYSFTIALKDTDNMWWTNVTKAPIVTNWSIVKKLVTIPTITGTLFYYDGTMKQPTINNLDSDWVEVSGRTEAISTGTYTITFSLKDSTNTTWSDGTTASVSYQWQISDQPITIPTVSNVSKSYDGTVQAPTIVSPDAQYINVYGTTSAMDSGTYTIAFELKDENNMQWTDGTNEVNTFDWSITKVANTLTLSVNSVSLDSTNPNAVVIATYNGDGVVTATSSDTSVVTTSVS